MNFHPCIIRFAAFVISFAATSLNVLAAADASAGGTISGRVRNAATDAYLEGATVTLQPSGRTTLTSRDGRFSFDQVPAQSYELTVSYTGMDAQTIGVSVEPGRVAAMDFALTSEAYKMEKFVVSGEREGNALAVQLQRNASNVKNVLSSDAFGNVPDENIGNFLMRVPGVSADVLEGQATFVKIRGVDSALNSVTVDGTRSGNGGTRAGLDRSFEIDTIPADFIDTIEVTKAPTPDMDADSIGGSVNLKTKSAFNQKGRLATYQIGGTYGTARKTLRPQGSVMYSDLFGRDRNIGVVISANYSWASNPRDTIFGAWQATLDTTKPAYFTLSSAGEDYFEHKRGGIGARIDYRFNERSTMYLNFMYSGVHDRLFRRRNSFSGVNDTRVLPGWTEFVTNTTNITYGLAQVDRWRGVRTYNLHWGGDQKLAWGKLNYDFNYSPSKGYEKRTNLTPQVTGVGFRFDRSSTIDDPAGATFVQISGPDITNPASMTFPSVGFTDDKKRETLIGGQANLRHDLATSYPSYLQGGFRFRDQVPKVVSQPATYTYVGPGGAALGRFFDQSYTYQPEALRGSMPSVHFFHIPTVVNEWKTNPQNYTINNVTTLRSRLTSDRNASEGVYAAYFQGHTQINRLGILAGVRVEETRVEGTGTFQFISPEEKARRAAFVGTVTEAENLRRTQAEYGNRVTNRATYRNYFPGIHFRYEITERLLARASYSTGIGRPSFDTIIPNNSVNDTTQVVTANNTSLKPQRARNFDVTLEYYFKPAGMFSVGVFEKKIKDFIFSTNAGVIGPGADNGFNGDYVGYMLNTQLNGGFENIKGIEVNYQQQFTNLPGFWRGFGVYANTTWLHTKGDFGGKVTLTNAHVPNFIPMTGSAGISYIQYRWTVRVLENFQGRSVGALNANPALQLYNYGKRSVNFNLAYTLNPRLTFFADVVNILGDSLGGSPYIYIPGRKRGADKFSPEIKAGISGRF